MKKMRFFEKAWFSEGELENMAKMVSENGTCMMLPYDQFVEHDNRHSFAHERANDPDFIMELAVEGGFNAVAVHYGVAKRFWKKWDGKIPLVVKVNGKTSIPSQAHALSTLTSFVEDAYKLGASGIGYTLYYGSDRQDEDLPQLAKVRQECEKYDLPLIVWAYPRGEAMEAKGGTKSSYALESAARLAVEMGATVVKSNIPSGVDADFINNTKIPKDFRDFEKKMMELSEHEQKLIRVKRIVAAAAGVPVLFSGGGKKSEEAVIENTKYAKGGGAFGLIYGRNMWKRPMEEALPLAAKLKKILNS
jgi:class I fructose-bisphosphate aldolase